MVEMIPSINAPTFEEVQKRIRKIEPFAEWCHLDVTDGVFSTHPTWRTPADLAALKTRLRVEAHLMMEEPERLISKWLVAPVSRVIVHVEAAKDMPLLITKCQGAGIQIGLAIRPDTSWEALVPWAEQVDLLQILAVDPGPSGQQMNEGTIDKLVHLRKKYPQCRIEIDGGITLDTGSILAKHGADILVVGSAIFNASDVEHAIREFEQL